MSSGKSQKDQGRHVWWEGPPGAARGVGGSLTQKAAAVMDASPNNPCGVLQCGGQGGPPASWGAALISKVSRSGNRLVTASSASTPLLTCRIARLEKNLPPPQRIRHQTRKSDHEGGWGPSGKEGGARPARQDTTPAPGHLPEPGTGASLPGGAPAAPAVCNGDGNRTELVRSLKTSEGARNRPLICKTDR